MSTDSAVNVEKTSGSPIPTTTKRKYNYILKPGRPTKYKTRYAKDLIEYFDQRPFITEREVVYTAKDGKTWSKFELYPKPLRFINGFCMQIGITQETFNQWRKKYAEFSEAYTCAKALYKEHLAVCGSAGLFNANFTQFLAKNTTDWTDRTVVEHDGKVESTVFFENMLNKARDTRAWLPDKRAQLIEN